MPAATRTAEGAVLWCAPALCATARSPAARTAQDAADELAAALPGLRELDLSGNLLCRWDEPAALLAALPGLHTLNLSGNRLALPRWNAGGPARPRLAGLRSLVLNGCGVAWADVCALAASLPCLVELHVAGNGISCLDDAPGAAAAAGAAAAGGVAAAAEAGAGAAAAGECEAGRPGGSEGGCGERGEAAEPLPPPLRSLQGIEVRRRLARLPLCSRSRAP
jgi:hypothetical protein